MTQPHEIDLSRRQTDAEVDGDSRGELAAEPREGSPKRSRWRAVLALPIWAFVLGGGVAVSAAWLWNYSPGTQSRLVQLLQASFFMLRVFQFELGIAFGVAMVLALLLKRWRLAIVAVGLSAVLCGAEFYRSRPIAQPVATGPALRVASMNVYNKAINAEQIVASAESMNADVLVIQEFDTRDGRRDAELAGLRAMYPHEVLPSEFDRLTLMRAIFSKYPLDVAADHPNADVDVQRTRVEVVLPGGERVAVHNVHHMSPQTRQMINSNMGNARSLVASLPDETLPAVWLGDFNAATWTPPLQWLRDSGLTEAQDAAGGREMTWHMNPSRLKSRLIPKVRIDQIFANDRLSVLDAGVGPLSGSDHRPIWADVQLRGQSSADAADAADAAGG